MSCNAPLALETTVTTEPILVGQCRTVSWSIPLTWEVIFTVSISVDDDGTPNGAFNECDEEDNVSAASKLCPYVTP